MEINLKSLAKTNFIFTCLLTQANRLFLLLDVMLEVFSLVQLPLISPGSFYVLKSF